MCAASNDIPRLQNPKTWPKPVQATLERIVAQLHFAHALLRERLLDSGLSFFPQFVGLLDRSFHDRAQANVLELLQTRFGRLPARQRPHYNAREHVSILFLMMRNAWSVKEAARCLIVSDKKQIPHNKYSEIVAWIAHDPLKPTVEVQIDGFRGDRMLPIVRINMVRDAKLVA